MPAEKKSRDWLLSITLVAYWATLFGASLYAEFPRERGETIFPLLVLAGLPIFILAARSLIHPASEAGSDLAYADDLTKLANRRSFLQDAHLAIKRARPGSLGLVLFDVNGLKQINDECGHQAGDELLVKVAEEYAQAGGKLYRIGGDEFAVLINRPDGETVSAIARKLDAPFSSRFATCGHEHEIGVAYGSTSSRAGDSFEVFFRRADDLLMLHKRQSYKTGRLDDRREPSAEMQATGTEGQTRLRLLD